MANKRMFTMKIVDSDAFLDMPLSTQCLYFHLNMRADDDGFIDNPKKIMRVIGAKEDDLRLLITKRFVLTFDNGVIVIKHWRMHNTIGKTRYTETQYTEYKNQLLLKSNKAYSLTEGQPIDDTQTAGNFLPEIVHENDGEHLENIWRTNEEQVETADIVVGVGIDIDIDNNFNKNIENNSNVQSDVFISIPLKDGSTFPVTYGYIDELSPLYPDVDIQQELRNMIGWILGKPERKKTARGIKSFISNWLKNSQKDATNKPTGRTTANQKKQELEYIRQKYAKEEGMSG